MGWSSELVSERQLEPAVAAAGVGFAGLAAVDRTVAAGETSLKSGCQSVSQSARYLLHYFAGMSQEMG